MKYTERMIKKNKKIKYTHIAATAAAATAATVDRNSSGKNLLVIYWCVETSYGHFARASIFRRPENLDISFLFVSRQQSTILICVIFLYAFIYLTSILCFECVLSRYLKCILWDIFIVKLIVLDKLFS